MKRVFYFCLLAVLINACGKEKSVEEGTGEGNYYIKFKFDGKNIEYRDYVFATKGVLDNIHYVTIQGQETQSSEVPGIGIFVQDITDIVPKTYVDDGSTSSNALVYSGADSVAFSNLLMTEPTGMNIVITSIDSNSVRGTFSSKVADIGAVQKTITDGEFSAPFQ